MRLLRSCLCSWPCAALVMLAVEICGAGCQARNVIGAVGGSAGGNVIGGGGAGGSAGPGAASGGASVAGAIGGVGGMGMAAAAAGGADATGGLGGGGLGGVSAQVGGVEQCRQLTEAVCPSANQCFGQTDAASCEMELSVELGCDRASGVDFSACASDARALSCGSLFPSGGLILPPACLPPINEIALSDAQSKCYDLVDRLCLNQTRCSTRVWTNADIQNCEDDVTTAMDGGIPCLLATAVGPSYPDCLAAVSTLGCDIGGIALATVPACAGQVLTFSP